MMFRRADTTIKPFQESSALITSGPFRLSRNPMYVSMTSVLLGVALLLGSLSPFLVLPLLMVLIQRRFIVPEESMLAATFGDAYAAYVRGVRRWL
jgi:protein-S-isoprenylcysteine O-methyltransferase Ste14